MEAVIFIGIPMYYRLPAPAPEEGFDELYWVRIEPEGGFEVLSPR